VPVSRCPMRYVKRHSSLDLLTSSDEALNPLIRLGHESIGQEPPTALILGHIWDREAAGPA
jgi:hypothetical protein